MTNVIDHAVPVSVLHRRLTAHRDQIRKDLAATPRWRWRRRLVLAGMAAAYSYEIEQILTISARWQPIWTTLGVDPHKAPMDDGSPT